MDRGSLSALALAVTQVLSQAGKCGKSAAQIVRWHLEGSRSRTPESTKTARIENLDVFDLALIPDESAAIDAFDTGLRGETDPELLNTRSLPFTRRLRGAPCCSGGAEYG